MVLDVAKDKARKIADSQFWSFRSYRMNFSFDDAYLAFEGMNLFEGDIFIYSFKDKSLHNLTNSASSEGAPVFSPDGKNLSPAEACAVSSTVCRFSATTRSPLPPMSMMSFLQRRAPGTALPRR